MPRLAARDKALLKHPRRALAPQACSRMLERTSCTISFQIISHSASPTVKDRWLLNLRLQRQYEGAVLLGLFHQLSVVFFVPSTGRDKSPPHAVIWPTRLDLLVQQLNGTKVLLNGGQPRLQFSSRTRNLWIVVVAVEVGSLTRKRRLFQAKADLS